MRSSQADKFVTAFVQLLHEQRKKQGMSHEVLAAKAGMHRSTISLIEAGKRIPSIHICYRLCHALGIPFGTLVTQAEKTQS